MPPQHTSVWAATAQLPTYAALTSDTAADVCIVGAGIAGLTTAYLLTQAGKSVVVLDDGAHRQRHDRRDHRPPGQRARRPVSSRSSGCTASDGARLAAESHTAAIDRIESIVTRERIDCDFTRLDGYLFCAPEHDEDVSRPRARGRAPRRPARRREDRPRAARRSTPALPALSEPGAVPSAQVPRRPGQGDRARRRPHLHAARTSTEIEGGEHADGDHERRHASRAGARRRRHQHAGQRPGRDPHQAGAVHDLRHRRARAARRRARRRSTGTRATRTTTSACSRSTPSTTIC